MGEMVRIAAVDDVELGGTVALTVGGRDVLLCRSGAGAFVIENLCSHQFARLEGGKVKGTHIFCPLHGVRFDMRTGAPNGTLTKKPITVFRSEVRGDAVYAEVD